MKTVGKMRWERDKQVRKNEKRRRDTKVRSGEGMEKIERWEGKGGAKRTMWGRLRMSKAEREGGQKKV